MATEPAHRRTGQRRADLELREYRPGDETAILELFERTFGERMSLDYWRWRFAECPAGKGVIQLAWDGDRLAGHYAVTPVDLSVDGRPVRSALSGTTMTHPDYRGRGLFPVLAERTYEAMSSQGMELVWGFPNRVSHRGFVDTIGWKDIYELPMLRLATGADVGAGQEGRIVELEAPDERVDRLWERTAPGAGILSRRDSAMLRWRYVDNPSERYRLLGLTDGDELRGYAVFKAYGHELQIVDLLYEDVEAGLALVLAVAREAEATERAGTSLWLTLSDPLHRALEKRGFHHDQPITYWGARVLADRTTGPGFYDFRRWHITLGDSDVF